MSLQTTVPSHLDSHISQLGATLGLPEEELRDVAATLMAMNGGGAKKSKTTRAPSKPREAPDDSDRCCARVWADGEGTRCKAKRCGGDYCKMHLRKIEEAGGSEDPCLIGGDEHGDLKGKRLGLFWGRYDHEKTGKNKAGQWVVYWNDPKIRTAIQEEQVAGTYTVADCGLRKGTDLCPGAKSTMVAAKKKPKVPKAPKTPKATKATKASKAVKEDVPKKPRGRSAYIVYMAEARSTIIARLQELNSSGDNDTLLEMGVTQEQIDKGITTKSGGITIGAIGKVGGKQWADLGEDGQAPYKATAEKEKATLIAAWESTQVAAPAPNVPELVVDAALDKADAADSDADTTNPTSADVFSDSDGEEEEEEMWNYTTPNGESAVVLNVDGDYIVMLSEWWEEQSEEATDEDLVAGSIGTITDVVIPADDDDEIKGTFSAK